MLIQRYVAALRKGRNIATNRYRVFSVGLGTVFMMMYIGYGVAFYYGANLVSIGEATPGTVFTVTISDYFKTLSHKLIMTWHNSK